MRPLPFVLLTSPGVCLRSRLQTHSHRSQLACFRLVSFLQAEMVVHATDRRVWPMQAYWTIACSLLIPWFQVPAS